MKAECEGCNERRKRTSDILIFGGCITLLLAGGALGYVDVLPRWWLLLVFWTEAVMVPIVIFLRLTLIVLEWQIRKLDAKMGRHV